MKITEKQFALSLYESLSGKSEKEAGVVIEKFVKVLVENNELAKFEKIIEEFVNIWNKEKGIVEAEITSAKGLDKEIVKLLNGYIVKLSGAKEVAMKEKIDKDLLGGVIIKYGDQVLDGSLKMRLSSLKDKMVK